MWIQTFTGRQFFPLAPRPDDIDIRDIAHSLGLLCRFNGHCRTFYSVAEHSVRVSALLPPEQALWGLLHDAAEAYLSDIPRPIKQQWPEFCAIEDRLLEVIALRYGLGWPMPAAVREADNRLLATEARDLMAPPPESWQLDALPLSDPIAPWTAKQACQRFKQTFRKLTRSANPH